MDQNMNWAHVLSNPLLGNHLPAYPVQSRTEPMDSDVHQAGFSTHELPQLPDTLPAFHFPAQGPPVGNYLPYMDPNQWAHFEDLTIRSPSGVDFGEEISSLFAACVTTRQLPISSVCESSQNVMHIEESMLGYLPYTSEDPRTSFNFQRPVMNQNLWEDGSNLGDPPIQFPPATMDDLLCTSNLGLSIDSFSSVPDEQINTQPAAACFPTLQLPVNVGGNYLPIMDPNLWAACVTTRQLPVSSVCESYQGMLHNEDYNSGHCGYTSPHFSSPLMEVVQGATTSSSRQTRRETGNSSHRTYVPWSIEDVIQLIRAVQQDGVKVKSWGKIVDQSPYFKDKGRKKEHLMDKWIHMMETDNPKYPEMRELYIWARKVEAKLQ